jgi:thiol-disulfide isomerase/thioredoxin
MAKVDAALEKGPVLVEFGADWCGWCVKQKPIVENLSHEYAGMTFLQVDVDAEPGLADAFYVQGIPQLDIVVKKNADGTYLYVDDRGRTTTDRYRSRIVGFRERDQLRPLVDAAIAAR